MLINYVSVSNILAYLSFCYGKRQFSLSSESWFVKLQFLVYLCCYFLQNLSRPTTITQLYWVTSQLSLLSYSLVWVLWQRPSGQFTCSIQLAVPEIRKHIWSAFSLRVRVTLVSEHCSSHYLGHEPGASISRSTSTTLRQFDTANLLFVNFVCSFVQWT